jgi:hypothetical protein
MQFEPQEGDRIMWKWLSGKKTYLVAATTFVLGGLSASGVTVPMWVYSLLAAAGLGTLRAGVGKEPPRET